MRKKQRDGAMGKTIQKAWARVGLDIVLGLLGYNGIWTLVC